MRQVKTGPKVLLAIVVIGGIVFGGRWWLKGHGDSQMKSSVPTSKGDLQTFDESKAQPDQTGAATAAVMPGDALAKMDGPRIKLQTLAWNGISGLALANGGPATTEGSLMQKHGVNLSIERQDDYVKMQESLAACANEIKQGKKSCATGVNFVIIMGDGGPAFLAGLNDQLGKIGEDYKAEIVGFVGRSYGEDKFMAPPNVVADKDNAKGLLVAGVLKDGDWNIALYWARSNGICNNPDPKTYDPNCLNWVGTSSFVEADDKYIQGYCEDRDVVKNNKKTGSTQKVCVNGVVTWTPGDVTVVKKKGGLVSVLSTKENDSQMPATIIGIKKWDADNHALVVNMLVAAYEGGDQIKRLGQPALMRAATANFKIFKEESPAYWAKYYRGVEETDAQGNLVPLGGSRVFNLADAQRYVGATDGTANSFAATYTLFGDIAKEQYPGDLPTYPPVGEVLNLSFLTDASAQAASGQTDVGKADEKDFQNTVVGNKVGDRTWNITFETGLATFTPAAQAQLKSLLQDLLVGSGTIVEVHGYTDNVGDAGHNQALSDARAKAVEGWLKQQAPANFNKEGKIFSVGHGQNDPMADNKTADGRAKNRRVVIIMKSSN